MLLFCSILYCFLMKIPQKYCRIWENTVFSLSLLLHMCNSQLVKILFFHPKYPFSTLKILQSANLFERLASLKRGSLRDWKQSCLLKLSWVSLKFRLAIFTSDVSILACLLPPAGAIHWGRLQCSFRQLQCCHGEPSHPAPSPEVLWRLQGHLRGAQQDHPGMVKLGANQNMYQINFVVQVFNYLDIKTSKQMIKMQFVSVI